ncbi:MAG: tetraacyldisaccharide 4'-kinase [Oligoflexales bacterium]
MSPFHQVTKLRRALYKLRLLNAHSLPGKTISVGNIASGGTGKTPVVIRIAQFLKDSGQRPVILTRGYRSHLEKNDCLVMVGDKTTLPPTRSGQVFADEAKMMAVSLLDVPVIVGANRWTAAQRYLTANSAPTHWILDDGFQHFRLTRDLDVVLLDAKHPFGQGWQWPPNILREPPSALNRADIVLVTRYAPSSPPKSLEGFLKRMNVPFLGVEFEQTALEQISGPPKKQAEMTHPGVVSAIANPKRLIAYIHAENLNPAATFIKSDHSRFTFDEVHAFAKKCDSIITTPKDYWRDPSVFHGHGAPVFTTSTHPVLDNGTLKDILRPVL